MNNVNTFPPMTKKELAFRLLRGDLLSGKLQPGDPLREIPLAARLRVSRIPLREAIDQLAGEGLVERIPGLGSRVRSAVPKELRELYEMREVLESFVVEKAAGRMTGALLGRLDDLCRDISAALGEYRESGQWTSAIRERLVDRDLAFHQTISQAAENEHLEKEIGRLQTVSELLSYRPDLDEDEMEAMKRSSQEHLGILEALRRADGTSARARMADHIRRAGDRSLHLLEAAARARKQNSSDEQG